MKTLLRPVLIFALTAAAFSAARAQQAMHIDNATGNPLEPFNLAAPQLANVLAPSHLGTGTPSSATYLRGDGVWVSLLNPSAIVCNIGSGAVGLWPASPGVFSLGNGAPGDASGTLFLKNVFAGGSVSGTLVPNNVLPPANLGTGTPSSTTFLRGDGSWAGLTPGGNTIAATSDVLMGDGAGNAAAVNSATLLQTAQARYDTVRSTTVAPTNLLSAANFSSGTINADGTITIPANGSVSWSINVQSTDVANTPLYGYVVATADAPSGALVLHANYGVDHASTDTTIAPGAYRSQFTNITGVAGYGIFLRNGTASPITVFFPVVATNDTGLALLASHADFTPVAQPSVADLDFSASLRASADRSGRYQREKLTTLAVDGTNGQDSNAGTLYAPFQDLYSAQGTTTPRAVPDGTVIGLYRGSYFQGDVLSNNFTGAGHGVTVQDVALGTVKALPVVSAMARAVNANFTADGQGGYTYPFTPQDSIAVGYYDSYVVEINTATEAATPIASRRRMTEAASASAVDATPGSYYTTYPAGGPRTITLHPSDSLKPGSGSYRYEITSRLSPAAWGPAADGAVSGLVLVGSEAGFGSLTLCPAVAGGLVADRLALIHCATHAAVISGSLQRSVFYESGTLSSVAPQYGPATQLVFYTPTTGQGQRWTLNDTIFYANVGDRPANCLLSHTGGTPGYDSGDVSRCAFLGARWSNTSLQGTAIDYAAVNGGVIDGAYVYSILNTFGSNMPSTIEVKNSVFQAVNRTLLVGSFHDNILESQGATNAVDNLGQNPACFSLRASGASVVNNLFWAHGLAAAATDNGAAGFLFGNITTGAVTHDIIVLNPASTATQVSYFPFLPPSGLNLDYNLVICTGQFSAAGPGGGYKSWGAYQAGYATGFATASGGLDAHSLFVDLSGDPRGLNAVFVDPVNGDFRWAQTDVARRCAAYCRANHVGPARVTSRWPLVPTVDEAVRLITDL